MSPPKLTRKPPLGPVITTDLIKEIIEITLREIDPCELQHSNSALPKEFKDCLRAKVLACLQDALSKTPNLLIEKKKRCCDNGKEGLWIALDPLVLDQLTRDMQKCWPRTGGGPPPNLGFTLMP